jgi:hypothetical protein
MRHFLRTALAAIATLTAASGLADTPREDVETAKAIEGTYLLYRWEDQDGNPIRKLTITAREGNGFSVVGVDEAWSGEGRIEGNTGYYNWVFVGGKGARRSSRSTPMGH